MGRFLNADEVNITITRLTLYHNAYAFCENNAVDNYDFYGYVSIKAMAMITCALAGAVYAISRIDDVINKDFYRKYGNAGKGIYIFLAAFIIGGISGLYAGSKITGTFQLLLGVIGAIIAVVSYLALHKTVLKSTTLEAKDLFFVAVKGFAVAALGVGEKTTKTKIIEMVLKACRLGFYVGLISELVLF